MSVQLSEIIPESHVLLGIQAKTRKQVFAALLAPLQGEFDKDDLLARLLQREELGSTGVGWGVAVPHVRLDSITTPVVVFGHLAKAIDFDAIDNVPCDIFFLVLAPTAKEAQDQYLQIMARISRLMRDKEVRDAIVQAATPAEVLEIIRSQQA